MANKFWVGGAAVWDGNAGTKWATTSGGTGGQAIPTAADDVFFDAASGAVAVTQSGNRVCRSLSFVGFTGSYNTTSLTISIGNSTGGSLTLDAGATWSNAAGVLSFVSTSNNGGAGWPITTAGKSVGAMTFNGAGGKWTLQDNIAASATITLTSGTLDTNSKTIQTTALVSSGAVTRTLTLGSSAITSSSTTATGFNFNFTGLTMTANTATFTFTGAGAGMTITTLGGDFNGLSIVFSSGSHTINGAGLAFTIANLTYSGATTDTMTIAQNITINSNLSLTGSSDISRPLVSSATVGTPVTITVNGTVTLTDVDLMDITGAGSTWSGTMVGDCQGNSGITFTTPATQTYNGAAGNWSDVTKWTSRVPLPQDDVIVGSGATGTVTVNMYRLGHNIDFTGCIRTVTFTGVTPSGGTSTWYVFGDFTLASGMTPSSVQNGFFVGRGAQKYTSNGKTMSFNASRKPTFGLTPGVAGSYALQDDSSMTLSTGASIVVSSTLALGSHTFTLSSTGTNALLTINTGGTLSSSGGKLLFNATTALTVLNIGGTVTGAPDITIGTASASARTIVGGGQAYGILDYTVAGSTGLLIISGSNTFGTINFSDVTNARTLTFTTGVITHVLTAFNVNGTAGKQMTINSAAQSHMLVMSSGSVSIDFVSIANSTATGGASWAAGPNSVDGGGNQGWVINGASTGGNTTGNMLEIF